MARIIRHGSTFTLPPEFIAQLGEETEWEVTLLGHGMYLEPRTHAQQWEAHRQRLEAVLARRRAQVPEVDETPEEIEEIVKTIKEVRRQHATPRAL